MAIVALALLAGLLGGGTAKADDLAEVKARMVARRDALQRLVTAHTVGENNRGFCEARATLATADAALVAAENADRKQVYADIAAKTGATPEQVGRQRAAAIAERAAAGTWIQRGDGRWVQKDA